MDVFFALGCLHLNGHGLWPWIFGLDTSCASVFFSSMKRPSAQDVLKRPAAQEECSWPVGSVLTRGLFWGDGDVPWTCTHVRCYATDGVGGGWWRALNLHTCQMLRHWWCGVGGKLMVGGARKTAEKSCREKQVKKAAEKVTLSQPPKQKGLSPRPIKDQVPPLNPKSPCPSPQNLKGCPPVP